MAARVRAWVASWSLRTRLLIIILGSEVVVFALSIVLVARQFVTSQGSGLPQGTTFLGIIIALWLTTLGITGLLVRSITQRLARMTARVKRQIGLGEHTSMLPVERDDELGELAAAFNQLLVVNAQSFERLSMHNEEMEMLVKLAATISQTLDLQKALDISLQHALAAIKWDAGAIYLWDDREDNFNMVSFQNLPEEYIREAFSFDMGEGVIGLAAQEGRTIFSEGDANGTMPASELASHISIPLAVPPKRLLGVLNLGSKLARQPTPNQLAFLTTISHHVAVALEKAQLHHDLALHAEDLEGVVATRTAALAQAIEELSEALELAQEAEKLKSLLLATVSHELRTPLATVKGYTSTLLQYYDTFKPETVLDFLTDIEEESDKLSELINNLLEMSRIEAGMLKIDTQLVNLVDVVESAVEGAQVRISSHKIRLETPASMLPVQADARRVQQIIDNLLDNAAKYSEDGTTIYVSVTPESEGPRISVRDEGRGIAPEHLEKIFERFHQTGKSRPAGERGIGLGLAICRGLVIAHDGRIWADSRLNKGSTFSFSLPAHQPEPEKEKVVLQSAP